ncbi:MAG: phosphopyruvate hydratase [Candidatus Andersenbacteria bacterium CG10_big_fil_rev_8_21_14_0_10_54_11]|uniref:Enolase n=1 Tax=Candidatus Andersenbacteria bacterium CG10_big_fil_rev_8_21_14_0_10_54_11 TaxID=1974485 RepID=A0A2M6WYY3_9BACT|nr:MAG: phosphopyruvate hydratase [Candidatus Andersenbacteria bacterium CG10_big_fil_rev_8_21_14_0_10_54_11]
MARIVTITAREVLDSRGAPTVEATVTAQGDFTGTAMVPAGISTGAHEAVELRDGDKKRYQGLGVLQAVRHVREDIAAILRGQDTGNQEKIDRLLIELDGTPTKSRLGANAVLAVSCACARAEAAAEGVPLYVYLRTLAEPAEAVLPVPQMNLINGGRHASNSLTIQEYHVVPVGSPTFAEGLRMGVEIYFSLRDLLISRGFHVEVAREGGFAPKLKTSEEALALLVEAIEVAGYVPGVDAFLGIDAAASEFYDTAAGTYSLDGTPLSAADLAYTYKTWREKYPLISFEDPFAEDAWDDWTNFLAVNGDYAQVVGDDLYVTNPQRITNGASRHAANAALIKPNQVGTLSETFAAIAAAAETKQNVIISHRSGETEDTFIADLAVAAGAGQIKTGAPSRSDRNAKYNRLLAIAEETELSLSHSLQPYLERQG